ncbi:uncharacterized protein LOC102351322 [Latimeria chalumnae]|uniref:uncharacterized protein LOC102351322 n=1 Tax=Latimeria chalumnae TaxID=7897 RepID=UPI0003C1661B|nr:PREDICTED: uncharacterized protein LOC102351322 [Latimeria chalumnae]XP_005996931.1 PREDICTED: uncharacterized protein LOC102351322 [Latimeria chalumnae]XP_005996932.1 PREDICTED: uncharacterized protein LOC102351322 [Latimeria chalumnae]|eukprot:XP_005996930.1 PREDICTED: uncharacterized protein LOC102351322 [Latimeria chalumnae]
MAFCDTEVRKVLKHVVTRWLSLGKLVTRILKQWDALKSYFLSNFDLEDDNTSGSKKKKSKVGDKEQRLVERFKDPLTKMYLMFIQAVIPIYDGFNTLLQSEEPLIHKLYPAVMDLYRHLLSNVIQPQVITEAGHLLDVDIEDVFNHLPVTNVYIGIMTHQEARKLEIIGTSGYNKFLKEVLSFYIKNALYLKKHMPALRDSLLASLIFISPECRQGAMWDDVEAIIHRFPEVVEQDEMENLHNELCDCQTMPMEDIPQQERIDDLWTQMAAMKSPTTNQARFPNLSKLVKFLLLLPNSTAYCKGLFSVIRKITTDFRSNLWKNVKEGQASSSVYQAQSGTRNTLVGLLKAKMNIFKYKDCH